MRALINWFYGNSKLASNVLGVTLLKVDQAAERIGERDLLSIYNLFPSPAYDYGYELLLNKHDLFETNIQKITQYV